MSTETTDFRTARYLRAFGDLPLPSLAKRTARRNNRPRDSDDLEGMRGGPHE